MLHVRVNVPPVPEAIEAMAEGLVRLNVWYIETALANGIELPALYDSGIRYQREPRGEEWWESAADVRSLASSRSGDCEDLAAYRAAELRVFDDDEGAYLMVIRNRRGNFHAIVCHGDGTLEDPSRILYNQERAQKRARKAA